MNSEHMPILRLQLDQVKYSILHSFMAHSQEINKMVEDSLNYLLTSESLKNHIQEQTNRVVMSSVTEEIERYFKYGEGQEIISESVKTMLKEGLK